jgi:hypothetical protein
MISIDDIMDSTSHLSLVLLLLSGSWFLSGAQEMAEFRYLNRVT